MFFCCFIVNKDLKTNNFCVFDQIKFAMPLILFFYVFLGYQTPRLCHFCCCSRLALTHAISEAHATHHVEAERGRRRASQQLRL